MPTSPKISVIIPVYNACPWLEKCLRHVCGQSLSEIEIIAVDDGSTDSSAELLADFQAADARVRLYRQEHLGVSAARNRGLRQAQGRTVLFLDADDYLEKNACQILFETQQAVGADMAVGRILDGKPAANPELWETEGRVLSGEKKGILLQDFNIALSACMKLFSRRFLEQNAFRFEPLSCWEDALFSLQTLCTAQKIVLCPSAQYVYVQHEGIRLSAPKKENLKNMLRSFSLGNAFLNMHPNGKAYLSGWRALQWICLSSYLESTDASAGEEAEIRPYVKEWEKIKFADLQGRGWKLWFRLLIFKGTQRLHLSYRRTLRGVRWLGRVVRRGCPSCRKKQRSASHRF